MRAGRHTHPPPQLGGSTRTRTRPQGGCGWLLLCSRPWRAPVATARRRRPPPFSVCREWPAGVPGSAPLLQARASGRAGGQGVKRLLQCRPHQGCRPGRARARARAGERSPKRIRARPPPPPPPPPPPQLARGLLASWRRVPKQHGRRSQPQRGVGGGRAMPACSPRHVSTPHTCPCLPSCRQTRGPRTARRSAPRTAPQRPSRACRTQAPHRALRTGRRGTAPGAPLLQRTLTRHARCPRCRAPLASRPPPVNLRPGRAGHARPPPLPCCHAAGRAARGLLRAHLALWADARDPPVGVAKGCPGGARHLLPHAHVGQLGHNLQHCMGTMCGEEWRRGGAGAAGNGAENMGEGAGSCRIACCDIAAGGRGRPARHGARAPTHGCAGAWSRTA
jgi:hypothetical protein